MPKTTSGFTGFGGYVGPAGRGQGDLSEAYGGLCLTLLAAGALSVGDAVYLQAANHVAAGATANLASTMGVIVGGQATRGRCYPEVAFGVLAATVAEQWVLVCISGKVRAISDAAIAAMVSVGFGGSAGRLDDLVTDATTVVGTRIGKSLTSTGGVAQFDLWVGVH